MGNPVSFLRHIFVTNTIQSNVCRKKDRESIWRQNHRLLITFSKLLCGKRPGWVKIKNKK